MCVRLPSAHPLISIELVIALLRPVLSVDIERLLQALVGLVVIGEQILQLLFLHLLLGRYLLKNSLIVLRSAKIDEHGRIDRIIV